MWAVVYVVGCAGTACVGPRCAGFVSLPAAVLVVSCASDAPGGTAWKLKDWPMCRPCRWCSSARGRTARRCGVGVGCHVSGGAR